MRFFLAINKTEIFIFDFNAIVFVCQKRASIKNFGAFQLFSLPIFDFVKVKAQNV